MRGKRHSQRASRSKIKLQPKHLTKHAPNGVPWNLEEKSGLEMKKDIPEVENRVVAHTLVDEIWAALEFRRKERSRNEISALSHVGVAEKEPAR